MDFVASTGLGQEVADVLLSENISYRILIHHMEKVARAIARMEAVSCHQDDLKDLQLPIGVRCLLWSEVQAYDSPLLTAP